ncbi:MAG: ribose-phosphate pyrophosphokinase [Bacteroidetes bacterium]|nr:MAG: ribose-phosphate pyrophosphokinase [Bacteroidota bacterium]
MSESQIVFFAGRNSRDLAAHIANEYGTELGEQSFFQFSDGEFQPSFECSVRGKTVFLIQSTNPPSDNLFELLLMADAARRASAYKIVAVMPYFGWARQDRKDKSRVPIGARVVANLIEATSIDRVMTMDLHADQIQGFFNVPVDHLFSSWMFVPYIKSLKMEKLAFASPDIGGAKRASIYAKNLHAPLIICHKTRAVANKVESMTAIGDVEGMDVILVDDMIDTAGTITKAADMMMDMGANSVSAIASHAVLSGPAYDRINASKLKELVVTDTIPLRADADKSKITVLSVASLFADVIAKVYHNESISQNYVF